MDCDLAAALRSRGVTVMTVLDAGLIGKPDAEQLAFSTERGCVLYTFNVGDFYRLHAEWISAGRMHGGILLAQQQHFSVDEQLRRILRIRAFRTAVSMILNPAVASGRNSDRPSAQPVAKKSGYHQKGELRRSWKLLAANAVPVRVGDELPDLG